MRETRRVPEMLAVLTAIAVLAAGCTFARLDSTTQWGCGPLRYEINPDGAGTGHVAAVHRAVARYTTLLGRQADFVGFTDQRRTTSHRAPDAPVLIEWYWDHEAAHDPMGFGEAFVADGEYVGGSIYLRPSDAPMPPWLIERLTMHELGHIGGLDDVDDPDEIMDPALTASDWGPGDAVGLFLTHEPCR